MKAESGMYLSMESSGIGCWHFSMKAESWEIFTGSGSIDGGFALRTKLYAAPTTIPATLWSVKRGATASSHVFGMASRGLSFFMLYEPGEAAIAGEKADLSAILQESLQIAGLEYIAQFGELSVGAAASMADRPRTASGDGWKAGQSFEQGSTHCVISSAARLKAQGLLAGAWASGSGGYLENPGWAASFDIELYGGKKKALPAVKLAAFIFGSSAAYLSPRGNTDLYDFLVDAHASIRIEPWSLTVRWVVASLKEQVDSTGRKPLANPDVSVLDLMPWLWKLDQARASLDLGFNVFALAARLNADACGLKNGTISLRLDDVAGTAATKSRAGATFGAAINARFARDGGIVDESIGEIGEESEEDLSMEDEISAMPGFSPGLNLEGFHLGAMGFECSVGWGGAHTSIIGNGKAQFIVSMKNMDKEKSEILLSGSLAQKFRIGAVGEASLSIKSPRGGYSLDATDLEFPLLELAFSIETTPARQRFPKSNSASIVKAL